MDNDKYNESDELNFSKPAIYQIKIKGLIDKNKTNYLADMQITYEHLEDDKPVSILIGKLKDQSALSGILNSLYDLHMPVISVKILKDADYQ
jgi:hypothetical protein